MVTLHLDGNVYNRLAADEPVRERLALLITTGRARVIATPIVADELSKSPFGGFPNWFAVQVEPEAVAVLGYARYGMARLGGGETYLAHRGSSRSDSNNTRDAIIAQSAESLADLFVSEDRRSRRRLVEMGRQCRALAYEEFAEWVTQASVRPDVDGRQ